MKRFLSIVMLLACTLGAAAQDIKLTIIDGLQDNTIKKNIEVGTSALLTEINRACAQERVLNLNGIDMLPSGKQSLQALWNELHFLCEDNEIIERCITSADGYVVRNIYIQVNPMVEDYTDERERSLTLRYTKDGRLSSAVIAASDSVYDKIVRQGVEVLDVERRQTILNFVENYRSHYDEKDIASLRQVFSDDALIITGTVVQRKVIEGDRPRFKSYVVYHEQNKTQYLDKLQRIFNNNRYIKVTFSEIEVIRHPSNPDYYAVTLHQHWKTSSYEDDGWVVLLWEFREGEDPVIHRRTWQPDRVGPQTLTRDQVINIMDFNIPSKR